RGDQCARVRRRGWCSATPGSDCGHGSHARSEVPHHHDWRRQRRWRGATSRETCLIGHPGRPAHLEAVDPATGIHGLSYWPQQSGWKSHPSARGKRGDRAMSLALAPFAGAVEVGELPCRQYDPDLWFADNPAELEVAKALCGECPLRQECLASALERREPWG